MTVRKTLWTLERSHPRSAVRSSVVPMQLSPSFEEFRSLAEGAGLVPVWREFLFDVDTAVTAYSKLAEPPFGFLLESVVGGEQWARYSFLGTRPRSAWKLHRSTVSCWRRGSSPA